MENYDDIKELLRGKSTEKTASADDYQIELTEAHLEKIASLVFNKIKDQAVSYVEEKTAEQESSVYERMHEDAKTFGRAAAEEIAFSLQKIAAATVDTSTAGVPVGGDSSLIFEQLKAIGNIFENPKNMTNRTGETFPNGGEQHPAGKQHANGPKVWDGSHGPAR